MKCHLIFCLLVIGVCQSWVQASPEAETLSVDELTAEHRSAKPEPFLDKIAAFFSGNTRKQDKPTYQQHGAASVPRPQYVRPPVPPKPPVRPPNLLKRPPPKPQPVYSGHDQSSSASSNFNSFASPGAGGGGGKNFEKYLLYKKSVISKVRKHVFSISKMAKKSIFAPEKSPKIAFLVF